MKKLTLATVALWTLFGVADIVSAQSDPDAVEHDTPGRCGDGDVGDSFATAYDLGNAEAWPQDTRSGTDGMEKIIVSDFECNGDLDIYRFEVSRSGLMWNRDGDLSLYDSSGTYVGDVRGRIGPGVYYGAAAAASDPDDRTETREYWFSLLFYPTPLEIQPTTARSPDGPAAVLLNLSPWQAWVHLYCQKDRPASDEPVAPCTVRFECNGMSGEPVTWNVPVPPKTIFSYWPSKTVDGMSANLQAALMEAGKTEEEARRRTTCEVFSSDPIAVRGYTLFGGQPTLVPVAVY